MQPEITKLLAGGLNLLPAGDTITQGDAIAAQNWRTDQPGILRSRKGHGAAVATPGGYVHTIITREDKHPQRYYGADKKFFRGPTELDAGLSGDPPGVVSFQDRLWVMDTKKQKKDDGANYWAWTPLPPDPPTFTAGGAATGGLNGDYEYFVTGVTDRFEDSSGSLPLAVTGLASNDSVTLTAPAFADPQITRWNVYRKGASFPLQSLLVNSAPIPIATTTYIDLGTDPGTGGDDQTDLGIATLGQTMPTNHDPAPAAKGLANAPYFNKILAFNSLEHPNRIWWTPSDQPWYFPGSQSDQDGNWVDVGEQGGEILGIAIFPRMAVVLKTKSIHRLVGDPDDWGSDIERTNADVGQIGMRAWAVAGSLVFIQADEGIFQFTGDTAGKLSLKLDPIFKKDGVATPNARPSLPINSNKLVRAKACMAYCNGRLYFAYPDAANTVPNTVLVFEGGRWVTDERRFTALYYEGQGGSLLAAYGGFIYELETGDDDDGNPITLAYQSRYEDQGAPENKKRYTDILVDHNTGGHVFSIWAYLDNGEAIAFLGTFASTSRTQTTFVLGDGEWRNIAIRLESTDIGPGHAEIHGLAVHYLQYERNARTYDTGKVPLGKMGYLTMLEADLEILSGTVDWELYSGITGLGLIASGSFAGSVKTFSARIPLALQSSEVDYKWARLVLYGVDFRCSGARIWSHDTGKIPLPKVSELSTMELDLEIFAGSVDFNWFAGIGDPGSVKHGTIAVTSTTTIQPPIAEARWIRLVLVGDRFRYVGARLQIQPIGCYLAGVGDIYRSGDITLGSPRLKLMQQVRVDCRPDGAIAGSITADQPNGQEEINVLALTESGTRTWQRQNMKANAKGQTARVEFIATSVCRIYAIQVRTKVLGEGSGSWQWMDVPVEPTPPGFSWTPLPELKAFPLPIK